MSGLSSGALAPPAGAWSETLQLSCSGPGFGSEPAYRFAAVLDTDVPATLPFGSSRATAWETHLFAPESFRSWAASQGYTVLYAGVRLGTAVDGVAQPEMYQPTRALTIPTGPQTWTWDPTPTASTVTAGTLGQHSLSVTSLGITVAFSDASGPRLATSATCVLDPATPNTVVDSFDVVAATTATTVAVKGDTATATVTSTGVPPVGVVKFSVGRKSVAMDVTAGTARVKLPALPPGSYRVSATFVPNQPTQLTPSTGTAAYAVPAIATTSEVSAVYRPARHVMRARVSVKAADRSTVSGRVTFVLQRNGTTLANVTVGLSDRGIAVKKFRAIRKPGRYVVVAKYLGTSTYLQSKGRVRLVLR
jgi:hypothetical protein